ncbi:MULTISPECIES: hypothetical protein [unclassified Deinococcus]|jgi:hypothetical protein|uniref:hypothetical protein n=1 Tax=unclassified Deinococcus TaxID=2623546 RepID=UPI001C304305|nr:MULTISPECIES: hypothetical protein [unclassified Deinococcus]MDK2014317.1 hypothetical protein [Deinococcus sp. 43]
MTEAARAGVTLETSEREFAARYAEFAAEGTLYPSREGSPLLEFGVAGRVLYLFDRSGPYAAAPGAARLVVHGVLEPAGLRLLTAQEELREQLHALGVSGVEGRGVVLSVGRQVVVVRARLPLVLGAFGPLPGVQPGDWVGFRTVPPLHGFMAP